MAFTGGQRVRIQRWNPRNSMEAALQATQELLRGVVIGPARGPGGDLVLTENEVAYVVALDIGAANTLPVYIHAHESWLARIG